MLTIVTSTITTFYSQRNFCTSGALTDLWLLLRLPGILPQNLANEILSDFASEKNE
jgi:hypothetical protein